ncbi:MAG: purine-nucleoside phosphorylase [Planctomycetota bacterium]
MDPQFNNPIQEATDWIHQRCVLSPMAGLILGTGSGKIADQIDVDAVFPYQQIPHFPRSTATGHAGKLVLGRLSGKPIVAMQGRFHLYEGWTIEESTLAVHVMKSLGISHLFVTNASGGLNPQFRSGDIMLIESHIDLMFRSYPYLLSGGFGRAEQRGQLYSSELIGQAEAFARKRGIAVQKGVYAAFTGPNYETRAEYRFLRRIGADVAGMSTIPEVSVASRYGLETLGLSIVTNIAKPDVLERTSGQEVIDAAEVAAPAILEIVSHSLLQL